VGGWGKAGAGGGVQGGGSGRQNEVLWKERVDTAGLRRVVDETGQL